MMVQSKQEIEVADENCAIKGGGIASLMVQSKQEIEVTEGNSSINEY